jgi:HSP20 family protein
MKTEITDPKKMVHIKSFPEMKDVFRQVTDMTNRIARRAFEIFEGNGFLPGRDLDNWLAAEREMLKPMAVEVKDKKDEFFVRAEVPGFEPKEIEVAMEGDRLIIRGKQDVTREEKDKEGKVIFSEMKAQELYRAIDLPAPVLIDKAQAEIKNGVLELTLPKAQKGATIPVKAA